jgi:photosystem II stability/assembly factor-like uncharacterized protein
MKRLLLGLLVFAIAGLGSSSGAAIRRSVPSGFQPLSFTAVSERDFWLLGTVPCRRGGCTAAVRTTDGGKTFTTINAPALPSSGYTPELRFADRHDGFAFVRWRGLFFATHDGGATWRRLRLGRVLGFATGARTVFVATARRLESSPVSANAWRARPLPFPSDGSPLDLEAHGASLWLLGTRQGDVSHDELAQSKDSGRTFVTASGPCIAGLGGELASTFGDAVWAVCPTGMLAGAWRSTNGGISFVRLRTPQLVNSAQIAPASPTTAVLARGGNAALLCTTDGGKTWRKARTPRRVASIFFVGFTDARVGAALVQTGATSQLWRTTDGGASWSNIQLH